MTARRETVIELVERAVDADLSRIERVRLLETLVDDAAAREAAREALALERKFADLAGAADNAPVPASPTPGRAAETVRPRRRVPLRDWLRPAIGALAGAAATAALLMTVRPGPGPVMPRLEPFAIAFSQAADMHGWTHDRTIDPGQTVFLVLAQDAGEDFHLRLASTQGALAVEAAHHRAGERSQQVTLSDAPVRYAVLRDPRRGDEVSLRNAGGAPVQVHLAASHPAAARFETRSAGVSRTLAVAESSGRSSGSSRPHGPAAPGAPAATFQ